MRPIAEVMFLDFFGVCLDQIYDHAAKIHHESGGSLKVPVDHCRRLQPMALNTPRPCEACSPTCRIKDCRVVHPFDAKGLGRLHCDESGRLRHRGLHTIAKPSADGDHRSWLGCSQTQRSSTAGSCPAC
jgi:hypothetical protein